MIKLALIEFFHIYLKMFIIKKTATRLDWFKLLKSLKFIIILFFLKKFLLEKYNWLITINMKYILIQTSKEIID